MISLFDGKGKIETQYITVNDASRLYGYNEQYLRRLLREGTIRGVHLGMMWVIEYRSIEKFFNQVLMFSDNRGGSRKH
jgi:hypothetical protein